MKSSLIELPSEATGESGSLPNEHLGESKPGRNLGGCVGPFGIYAEPMEAGTALARLSERVGRHGRGSRRLSQTIRVVV